MSTQIIKIDALQKYYGAKFILDDIKMNLNRGERAALVGENGVGKSTLARLVLGLESPDHGVIVIAQGVAVAYLPQELQVADDIAVMEYIESGVGEINRLRRDMARLEAKMENGQDLDALLLEYGRVQELFEQRGGYTLEARLGRIVVGLQIDHVSQLRKVMSLSGGEKTRVGLAALLLQEPDLLILDEPTNHLDRRGLIWLEEYLLGYPNALLMITHDRHSINRLATKIIDLSAVTHNLTTYHGNYDAHFARRSIVELRLGQRRKLGLACLIQRRANVLILDDPTNHLDLPSLEALEDALMRFPGAILAATHDKYFIDKVVTAVWHLHKGNLIVE